MKKYMLIIVAVFMTSLDLLAQMTVENATIEKNKTSATIILNDVATFKNQFENWNVGNLHIYSRGENTPDKDYYFTGKKTSPIFQQYLPDNLKQKVTTKGSEPYFIAAVRGNKLDDYYLMRINDGKSDNTIVLYELEDNQLQPKKTLAYYYTQHRKAFQLDSWMQDVNGDTRLDLIQKDRIVDADGQVAEEKTRVWLQKKNGKFKRSRKAKIKADDYPMRSIQ